MALEPMTRQVADGAAAAPKPPDARPLTERLADHVPLFSLIALCIVFSLATDTFLSVRNLVNVIDQLTVLGIMALGMTAVIVIGGIDLSV